MGNLFINLLFSDQGQSLMRTLLKVGGTLLVAKGNLDPSSLDTIVGGVMGLIGVLHSIGTHAPTVTNMGSSSNNTSSVPTSFVQ